MSEDLDLRLHDGQGLEALTAKGWAQAAREALTEAVEARAARLMELMEEAETLGVVTRDLRGKVAAQLRGIRDVKDTLLGTKEAKADQADGK